MALSSSHYGDVFQRMVSPPCPVLFQGWRSTTAELQAAGWRLAASQDIHSHRITLALEFPPARVYAMSETVDFDYLVNAYGRDSLLGQHLPTFHVRYWGADIVCQTMGFDISSFEAIDAKPSMLTYSNQSMKDLKLFAAAQTRTEEIIVEPQTVESLLAEIKKLQAPELAAIRERNRKRETRERLPAETFHAQIISIAA